MNIAIIGCGKIGSLFAKKMIKNHKIFLHNRHAEKARQLAKEIGAKVLTSLDKCNYVILATKPQDFEAVASELEPQLSDQTILSTLTGISLDQLERAFGKRPLFRVVPNLAADCGQGIIGIAGNQNAEKLLQLFAPLGQVFMIPEEKLNAFAALIGSGPAFMAVAIEAMVDAAIAMGFNAQQALSLILQMIQGTATLIKETAYHPGQLKWDVASPGGITIAGLKVLEKEGFRHALIHAFHTAQARADELYKD